MIIKIQQSMTTSEKNVQMLIYNESRDIFYQADLIDSIKDILNGRLKAYFKATLVEGNINILKEVKEQNW